MIKLLHKYTILESFHQKFGRKGTLTDGRKCKKITANIIFSQILNNIIENFS